MMKFKPTGMLICLITASLHAQSSDARSAWASISSNLIASAAKFPEADYNFQPTAEVRTFAQLIGHVADAHFMFCAPMLPQAKPKSGAAKLTTKAELLTALKDSVSFCTAAADRATDSLVQYKVSLKESIDSNAR